MEQSSSGRLKKMGFDPSKTKSLDLETTEEKEVEAASEPVDAAG